MTSRHRLDMARAVYVYGSVMDVIETPLPGLVVLKPVRHGDTRGFFSESWNRQRMEEAGLDIDFVQDNHSLSAKAGTLRGMHFPLA